MNALLSFFAAALHAATSWRYGYFRDELYFIACSKHLAWGYVDQPPLVALAAWLSSPFGYALPALRALPILAAAGTVYLAVRIASDLGGARYARFAAGVATLLLPAYLLLGNTLTTTSFEPFSWTLALYCTIRIVRGASRYWYLGLGAAIAFGCYGKYSMGLLAVAIVAGLLLTPQRRVLFNVWALAGAALALALLLPNLIWQTAHGWPFVDVLLGDAAHRPAFQSGLALEYRNLASNALAFCLEQVIYTNPLTVPLWIAGIVAPFRVAGLRDLRFLSIACAFAFVVAVLAGAKGYYIVGIYATLVAIGAVAFERAAIWARTALVTGICIVGIASMPLSLPVLSVDALIGYMQALHVTGQNGSPAHLMQPVFAEEFGWDRLAHDVAAVYDKLPGPERAQAAIYADTYGDAGALDFFGPRYGLPPAISSQNTYYLWGTRGYSGTILIAIGATRIDLLRKYYRSVTLVTTSPEPYKWVVEGPAPIYVCRDPIATLDAIWPHLRWYGA